MADELVQLWTPTSTRPGVEICGRASHNLRDIQFFFLPPCFIIDDSINMHVLNLQSHGNTLNRTDAHQSWVFLIALKYCSSCCSTSSFSTADDNEDKDFTQLFFSKLE